MSEMLPSKKYPTTKPITACTAIGVLYPDTKTSNTVDTAHAKVTTTVINPRSQFSTSRCEMCLCTNHPRRNPKSAPSKNVAVGMANSCSM